MSVELRLAHNLSQFFKFHFEIQKILILKKYWQNLINIKMSSQSVNSRTYINDGRKTEFLVNQQSGERVTERVFLKEFMFQLL